MRTSEKSLPADISLRPGSPATKGKLSALLILSALILCTALPAFASEKSIGVIMPGDIPYFQEIHTSLLARLAREGLNGRVEIIMQKPYPDMISMSNAARKLIALNVDVIVAYGVPAAMAVAEERTRTPMVYAGAYEPSVNKVKMRNSTGISAKIAVSSLLRYLRAVKGITSLGVVYNSAEEDSLQQLREITKFAGQYGFKVEAVNVRRHQDAKALLAGKKIDALFITGSAVASIASSSVTEFAREHRIPTAAFAYEKSPQALISLFASPLEQGEKAGEKVARVLEGVPPERIRPDSSNNIELIFNLREASAMGWRIPMELVTEATRLIK